MKLTNPSNFGSVSFGKISYSIPARFKYNIELSFCLKIKAVTDNIKGVSM